MSRYATAVLADVPKAYYRLDEPSGSSAKDLSGNSRTGTINGSIGYSSPGALKNDVDSSMTFNGSSTYISLPSGILSASSDISVEAWVNTTTFANDGSGVSPRVIAGCVNSSNGYILAVSAGGIWAFAVNDGGTQYITSTTGNSTNTWYHLVGTYVASSHTIKLYINGSLASNNGGLASGSYGLGSTGINIGRRTDGTGYLTGPIDEAALYSYALSATQISNHYTIGSTIIGSNTQYDLSVYKEQMIYVYKPDGTFVDCVRDAPVLAGFKESINAVTSSLKVQLPRKFEAIDLPGQVNAHGIMQQGYIWKYYLFGPGLPPSGLLRYSGQVDEYAPQISESGEETIAVTLTPQGSAIADSGLGATLSFGTAGQSGTYIDPISQFNYWFNNADPVTGQAYCYPLTLDPTNPTSSGIATQFTYTNQTIKSILDNVILMLPANYFYRTNPDNTVTLNQTPTTAQHVLQVGVHISNPQYSQSWIQTQTAVFFLGGIDPTTVTKSNPNGNPIIAIKRGVDMQTIGKRLYLHNESRVTDQATANILAQGDLNYYDQPMLRTKIRVPDFRGPNASIGYDIESIKAGDSIQIQDNTYNGASTTWDNSKWDSGIWDQSPGPALNTVGIVSALTYGYFFVDLEIGLPQPNLARAVSALQQKMEDFTLI